MVDNPEAFPNSTGVRCWSTGMTLRDYFAAAALNGFVSANEALHVNECTPDKAAAVICYKLADALLAERAKETP